MSYARLSKRPLLFRSFTGLEVSEFDAIYAEIQSRYSKYKRKHLLNARDKEMLELVDPSS
jgi:hypothetical protein